MAVRRSLKFDSMFAENSFHPSKSIRKERSTAYSPATGACQTNPSASPAKPKRQKCPNGPASEKKRNLNNLPLPERKESTTEDSDELLILLSEVENSSEEIMEIMKDLKSIQALEGSRELQNLIGFFPEPGFFIKELKKTEKLMMKITKQKLFEKKSSELANKELHHHIDSNDFLKAILK